MNENAFRELTARRIRFTATRLLRELDDCIGDIVSKRVRSNDEQEKLNDLVAERAEVVGTLCTLGIRLFWDW